ncbi:MAG: MATE family efflux transporter [Aminobacteriaceae bacterium]
MNTDRHVLDTERVGGLLFRLSMPSIIGMIVMASYNIADSVFIGHGVGPIGLAAVMICFPIQFLGGAMSIMAGVGGSSIISRSLGAGDVERAERALGATTAFSLVVGVFVFAVPMLFIDEILSLFGASPDILPHARDYLSVILFGMPFQMFGMAGNHMARAEGRARIAMASLLISAILNIILDPIFIFVLGLGVWGAAAATVISQFTMFIWIFGYFCSGRGSLRIKARYLIPRLSLLREITAIGLSEFTRMAAGSLSMVLINAALIRWGGDLHVAVYGVIHRGLSFFFMPMMGIAQGFQPILGYNYGAGRIKQARTVVGLALSSATLLAFCAFLTTQIFPAKIFAIFTTDQTLIVEGTRAMRIITGAFFFIGFQTVGSAMFQALGKARPAFILSLSRQVLLLIPLVLTLPALLASTDGVWLAFPVADSLSFFVTLFFFRREMRSTLTLEAAPA